MGGEQSKPVERRGASAATRSGLPPPKLKLGGRADQPYVKNKNDMNLQLHLDEARERVAMSPAEREWRKKYVLDQRLHPDEPVRVEAVYRQLNPIRKIYRYPWDLFFEKVLHPKLGLYNATAVRAIVPKLFFVWLGVSMFYYHIKYEFKRWDQLVGAYSFEPEPLLTKKKEIEAEHPGLIAEGFRPPSDKMHYGDYGFRQRGVYKDLGPPKRPW